MLAINYNTILPPIMVPPILASCKQAMRMRHKSSNHLLQNIANIILREGDGREKTIQNESTGNCKLALGSRRSGRNGKNRNENVL